MKKTIALIPGDAFGKKPMHVFGFLGTIVFIIGFFSALFLGVEKAWALYQGIPMRLVTNSPYFYIASVKTMWKPPSRVMGKTII